MAYSSNQSLSKAFMILEVLNVSRTGMTASEVAERTGLPASTVHRFLQNSASSVTWRGSPMTSSTRSDSP